MGSTFWINYLYFALLDNFSCMDSRCTGNLRSATFKIGENSDAVLRGVEKMKKIKSFRIGTLSTGRL
jgi:hypothetical protein